MEMISVQEGIACAQFVKGYPLSEKVYKLFSWAKLVTTCDLDADLSGGHLWQTMRLGVHVLSGNGNLNISAMQDSDLQQLLLVCNSSIATGTYDA